MLSFVAVQAQNQIQIQIQIQIKDKRAPIPVPQILGRGLGMMIGPYTDRPPDITFTPHGPDARHGHVWVQNIGYGLLIVGEVDGERPDFPRNKNLILEKDHVEIWLADGKDPELPAIGWGNQFEQVTLPKDGDFCAGWAKQMPGIPDAIAAEKKCRNWTETQIHYRPYFKRLFVRQWLMTPNYALESFASPAYDKITERFATDQPGSEEVPTLLKPVDKVQMRFGPGKDRVGYSFEIMIPFIAFPPLSNTELGDLRLLVDVFNPPVPGRKVGAYSTSSPARVYGKPETFNLLQFAPPYRFHLTPCDLPLPGKDKDGTTSAAWFVPKTEQSFEFESDAFFVANDESGYQIEPDALSPTAHRVHYFWHAIAESEWICGPHLSYRKGGKSQSFDVDVAEDGFDAHRLPDGDLLIKVGPRVYGVNSNAQCGACPRTELRVFRLSADRKLSDALQLGDVVDNGTGASQDFTVSPDWSQVVQYDRRNWDEQGKPASWSSTMWCLGKSEYEKCGSKDNAAPPDPPVLKELRDAD